MSNSAGIQHLYLHVSAGDGTLSYTLRGMKEDPWTEVVFKDWSFDSNEIRSLTGRIQEKLRTANLQGEVRDLRITLDSLGQILFQTLFPPEIAEILRGQDSEYLLLHLAPKLFWIPWELAHDDSNFLSCRFAMGRIVDRRARTRPQATGSKRPKISFLIVSNPTGDLPSSTRECEALWRHLSRDHRYSTEWLNGKVDHDTLQKWFGEAEIIHYSGHGATSSGNSPSIAWKLRDGIFEANSPGITAGVDVDPPLLIFSNTCGGDGIVSEGAPTETSQDDEASPAFHPSLHFIATQCELVDSSGGQFSELFYQYALNGEPLGKALKLARLANRYSAENADYTWAQYVLYGDPRTGLFGRTRIEPKLLTLAYLQIGTRDSKSGFDLGKLRRLVDLCVARLPGAEVLELNENSAILLFPRHTDAARFVFLAASELESKSVLDLPYRMGIATGELLIERGEDGTPLGVTGFARDLAEKLAELAGPCQTLLTRDVFDNARSLFQGTDYASGREMVWRDHGYFRFEDADEIVGVCEAGISGISLLQVPDGNQSLHRLILPEWEPILGWRPAPGQVIPSAPEWAVVEKLGEGGFGEVWRTRHRTSGNSKIFKFCFHPDRLRSLKREVALLKIIKNRLGERPDIVRIEQINLETPPYFLVMDDTGYRDLVTWRSNLDEKSVPTLDYRIEIVAKIGDALQAAHDAGVIHRDIKPSNVLVSGRPEDLGHLQIKLTDFGIGQVHTSGAPLTGTMTGFTGTLSQPEKAGQGTLMYLAPEALLGVFGSARSDIYSLGVILYQILVDDFSRPIAVGWERDLDDPDLKTDLEKCLSRNPEERFRSPGELAENLRSLEARRQKRRDLERQERRERRRKRIAVGLGIFSLVGFLVAASLGLGLRRAREAEFRERVARLEAERGLYHSHIHEAHRAVQDRDLLRAQEILYDCPDYLRGWEWGRLVYLCNLDQRIFSGHENPIHSMALSADGKILATGDEEGTLIAWDFESAQVLWRAKNRGGGITDLAINSDGDKVAETDGNGIRVRDLASGHPIRRFQCLEPTGVKLRFAPDRDLLAASNGQGMLVLFDLTENATSAIAVGNGNVIADLAFTPDGTSIITVGYDANLRIFDVETLQQMDSIDGEGVAVNAVAVDKDGGEFAIAFGDRIRRGRLPGFELLPLEKEVPGSVHCLSISPGNKFIAYKTNQGVYGILDLQTFEDLFVGSGAGPARSVLFTPTGDSFLVAGRDHRVRQYRCSRRLAEIKLSGHTGFVPRLCFSGDGRRLATGSDDRTVRLWDTRTGEATAILEVSDGVASLAFSPEDDCLAAGTRSGRVVIWSTSGTSELADFQAHTGVATSIAFHPNGSSFATGGFDGRIRVWDRSDFTLQLTIEADRIGVFTVVYTPDGERLVSGGGDPTLKEWDTKSGSLVRTYSGHASQVFGMLLFSEGKRMISGSSDRRAILWDRQTGESIGSIHEKESALFGLRVTPDMNRLFTNGRLWDLENFRPIMELPNRDRTLSPDGLLMAEGGEPNHLSILPAFPWRDTDLSEKPGLSVRERVEAYKQRYWSKRQDLAGSRN